MKILLHGGQVYEEGRLRHADIRIDENGLVEAVGQNLPQKGAACIDISGMVVSPGFTDLHVHLRQPGFEAKETVATGTAAAAAGGFTTVCSMPNLTPVPDELHTLEPQLEAIRQDAAVRVLPYGAITAREEGTCLSDISVLADFVCGFSDDGRGVQDEDIMERAMALAARHDSFIAAHCEVNSLLPKNSVTVQEDCAFAQKHGFTGVSNQSEWAEVERDITLAQKTDCRLHICHVSTAESFKLIQDAKAQKQPVTCEVTPHNLLLCCDDITGDDGRFKMNPPLRTAQDRRMAVEALLNGTIDAVATDHAPHTPKEKSGGFAQSMNGVTGLETAFASLYTGLVMPGTLPLERLLYLLTEGPRHVLREMPNHISPGKPADLVVLGLNRCKTVQPETFLSKGRSSPFEGKELYGWPVFTMYNGTLVWNTLAEAAPQTPAL